MVDSGAPMHMMRCGRFGRKGARGRMTLSGERGTVAKDLDVKAERTVTALVRAPRRRRCLV